MFSLYDKAINTINYKDKCVRDNVFFYSGPTLPIHITAVNEHFTTVGGAHCETCNCQRRHSCATPQ